MSAVKVVFMSGPDDGLELELKSDEKGKHIGSVWRLSIGRSEECDIIIPYDTQVSRIHAHICKDTEKSWIEDAGSRNGTYVGSQVITGKHEFVSIELFRVGRTWLRVEDALQ